ncbi:MAG: hypothetical protein U0527_01200 [Candidatus Eisenbacteria bacterium]
MSAWKRELLSDLAEPSPAAVVEADRGRGFRRLKRENRSLRQEIEFLNSSVLREGLIARFRLMQAHRGQYPVAIMSRALRGFPSGYHAYCQRPPSPRALE